MKPGPVLGIDRGCDGLGPSPVGPRSFLYGGGVYRKIVFIGGIHSTTYKKRPISPSFFLQS